MHKFMTVLFAGALAAAMAFALENDNGANLRFHMKTGRDLPSVEKARLAAAPCDCSMMKCNMVNRTASVQHSDAEQHLHMKTARYSPGEEAHVSGVHGADAAVAMNPHCAGMECCRRSS